ncbi:LAFA_0E12134g1_1 [Lachancea sp. 'fantastica']|nr:LAFA_0E12134g1_1 [Lachancea sp. 'fantastica']
MSIMSASSVIVYDSSNGEEKEAARSVQQSQNPEVPDGGFGWFVVAACFIYNFSSWGANSSYAVFIEHYINNGTFKGGSNLNFAAIGGLTFGTGFLFAPIITWLYRRFGPRLVIGMGVIFQAAAFMLAAYSKYLWQLYLTQGVLLSFGLASIFIPSITLLPFWFLRKRALAMGLASSGSGIGGIIFNLATEKIIEVRSVKWALIIQFIICLVLNTIALLFTRTRESAGSKNSTNVIRLFDKQLFSTVGYWLLLGWISFTMFGYVIVLFSLSDFTVSLGYSSKQGSYVTCMISVGWTVGRPIIGFLSDKFGAITVGFLVHLTLAILCWAMWIPCRNLATAIAFALLQGLLMGTVWTTLGSVTARVVGLKKMSAAFATLWIVMAAFGISAPIIGLELANSNSSRGPNYTNTAIFAGFGYFGAALCQWILRGYIMARDQISNSSKQDANELDYQTEPMKVLVGMFKFQNIPKKI